MSGSVKGCIFVALFLWASPALATSVEVETRTSFEYSEEDLAAIVWLAAELGVGDPSWVTFLECPYCTEVPCEGVLVEVLARTRIADRRSRVRRLLIGRRSESCEACPSLDLLERRGWVTLPKALNTSETWHFEGDGWTADISLSEGVDYERAARIMEWIYQQSQPTSPQASVDKRAPAEARDELLRRVFVPTEWWSLSRRECPSQSTENENQKPSTGLEALDFDACFALSLRERDRRSFEGWFLGLQGDEVVLGHGYGGIRC